VNLPIAQTLHLETLANVHVSGLWHAVDSSRESLRRWLPWVDGTRSLADSAAFVTAARAEHRLGAAWHFAVVTDAEVIGVCALNRIDSAHRWASVGYWLHHGHTGQGTMIACVRRLVGFAFDELAMHRLEIRCAEHNWASRAIPERLGFVSEGLLRDVEWINGSAVSQVVYSQLTTDASRG